MEPAYMVELVAICGLVERLEGYAGELARRYSERARSMDSESEARGVLERISRSLDTIASVAREVRATICSGGPVSRAAVMSPYRRLTPPQLLRDIPNTIASLLPS